VGSAKCPYTRINNHLNGLWSNKLLQDSIVKRGLKAYSITYVVTKTHAEAKMQEQLMLDYLFQNNIPKYNLSANAYGGDGSNAKVIYTLEVNNPNNIYIFKSSIEAANFTNVFQGHIHIGCKNAKPLNGNKRWLFSDISIDDLKAKFNNLTLFEIKGRCNRLFMLVNKINGEQSQIFNSVYEPQKQGYKINQGSLSKCLLGNRRTANGYYVILPLSVNTESHSDYNAK
jgi:hypothetical protein